LVCKQSHEEDFCDRATKGFVKGALDRVCQYCDILSRGFVRPWDVDARCSVEGNFVIHAGYLVLVVWVVGKSVVGVKV
jgi:hypothetical protein